MGIRGFICVGGVGGGESRVFVGGVDVRELWVRGGGLVGSGRKGGFEGGVKVRRG